MDTLEKFRKDETRRLICWIRKNKNSWLDILNAITEQNILITEEFRDVVKSLRDNGFYQFLVLLLYTNNDKIQNAIEEILLLSVDTYWDENLLNKMIDLLLEYLVDENI